MKLLKHLLLASAVLGSAHIASAQGTAFTYQGRLNDSGNPATGLYDLTFALFDVNSGSSSIATAVTNSAVCVTNGLFTFTLDFGANFPGANRWLEIGVRTNGADSFTTVLPRQPITATPYAITASNLSGTLPVAQLSGTLTSMQLGGSYSSQVAFSNPSNSFAGNGGGLTNVNAATLNGLSATSFWKTTGNAGTSSTNGNFVGTTDNRPLELWVNSQRAFRLEPTTNTPNVIGGWISNAVSPGVAGATIGGGGAPIAKLMSGPSSSATYTNQPNLVSASYGTIGGGLANQVGSDRLGIGPLESCAATIAGGLGNSIWAQGSSGATGSAIGGGFSNQISGGDFESMCNTIAGGSGNQILHGPAYCTIGGGQNNLLSNNGNTAATIGGGSGNYVDLSNDATISGGSDNEIEGGSVNSVIAGGVGNEMGKYPVGGAIASAIGGGATNEMEYGFLYCTIAGGMGNTLEGTNDLASRYTPGLTISGGVGNVVQWNADNSTISGGANNTILAGSTNSVITGGASNNINGRYATIAGGLNNTATNYAFAAGSFAQATNSGAFVWADTNPGNSPFNSITNNEFAVRATGGTRFVTAIDGGGNVTAGVALAPGATSWSTISDRNAKKDFAPVDGENVLDKLSQVPVEQWRYKWEANDSVPHIGPMAQDFKHAFYPGRDDKSITTLEFDGVELAAIEGLNQKLQQQAETIQSKDARINDLEQRLERLEKIISATEK